MTQRAISISAVSKSYGPNAALRGVDLEVDAGQIMVMLGPNGAGKTTLISIVAGLRRPDAGSVVVNGVDVTRHGGQARAMIGLAAQDTAIYPTVSVRDNLRLFGRVGGLWGPALESRIEELADVIGLSELLDRKARFLSGGEKRRLHTALAMVHRPAVLLLDEPTTGADPLTRANMLGYVAKLAGEGTAVVYTTHYLTEVETLGSTVSVAILNQGQIIAAGQLASLLDEYAAPVAVLTFHSEIAEAMLVRVRDGLDVPADVTQVDDRVLHVASRQPIPASMALLSLLGRSSADLRSLDLIANDLESVFLSITGQRYGDA